MERKALAFMPGMILDELADAVGGYDHISIEPSERATYGVDLSLIHISVKPT